MSTLGDWKIVEPTSYYKNFIDKKSRPDNREWMESRPLLLKVGSINTADGSATVRLGNTSVVCGIKAEITTPTLRQPDQGFIVPNVELYPCCSSKIKPGPPGDLAMNASQFLLNVLEDSELLDLKTLCVLPNKVAWCLYCDIVCLDYDGNLYDAVLLAFQAALRNVLLPKVTWDEEKEKITEVSSECTEKLEIKNYLVATTFSIYSDDIYMLDPCAEDEDFCHGSLTFVFQGKNICTTIKPGGKLISEANLDKLTNIAKHRVKPVTDVLIKAIK